jgi:hypothetical protein
LRVEQHLVGLLRIGPENESAAVGELEVSDLKFGPLAAEDRRRGPRFAGWAIDRELRQRRARADGGMSMFFIVPLRVRIPGVIGSLFTVLVVWPVLAMMTYGLIRAYPVLGWIALTFAAVPLLGRVIDRLERKPPTP